MPVTLLDSFTPVTPAATGDVVVTSTHGGVSVLPCARPVCAMRYGFNDAGVGKDRAGIAALDLLQAAGVAACAVAHASARIGETEDAWAHGVVRAVNARAAALGIRIGQALRAADAPLL